MWTSCILRNTLEKNFRIKSEANYSSNIIYVYYYKVNCGATGSVALQFQDP